MKRPLRIAIVVDPFRLKLKGGDHAPRMARELLGLGHVVRGFGATPGAIPRAGDDSSVLMKGSEELKGLLGFEPDVIVGYDGLSPSAWHAARQASRLDVPLVLVEEGFPDRGRSFERAVRWLGERVWGPYVRRRAATVVALDVVAEEQAHKDGFSARQVVSLPSGVDLATYRPGLSSHLPAQHAVRGRILLYLGGFDVGRGLEILIESFANSIGRRGDWSLFLAGAGASTRQLRAQASRLGVGAHLHWMDPPRREEMPGLLGSATLLVAPNLEFDVTGWRTRRALACGLPVIAGDGTRSRALIEHEGCGLLVTPDSVEEWTRALSLAAGSPARRNRWRTRARQLAEQRYSWPLIAAEFEAILANAVMERAAGAELAPGLAD